MNTSLNYFANGSIVPSRWIGLGLVSAVGFGADLRICTDDFDAGAFCFASAFAVSDTAGPER